MKMGEAKGVLLVVVSIWWNLVASACIVCATICLARRCPWQDFVLLIAAGAACACAGDVALRDSKEG